MLKTGDFHYSLTSHGEHRNTIKGSLWFQKSRQLFGVLLISIIRSCRRSRQNCFFVAVKLLFEPHDWFMEWQCAIRTWICFCLSVTTNFISRHQWVSFGRGKIQLPLVWHLWNTDVRKTFQFCSVCKCACLCIGHTAVLQWMKVEFSAESFGMTITRILS